jgi:hypothetical protein
LIPSLIKRKIKLMYRQVEETIVVVAAVEAAVEDEIIRMIGTHHLTEAPRDPTPMSIESQTTRNREIMMATNPNQTMEGHVIIEIEDVVAVVEAEEEAEEAEEVVPKVAERLPPK